MSITDLIIQTLQQGTNVEIPGIGTFESVPVEPHHDAAKQVYYPASRTVAFNPATTGDEGMVKIVAQKECVSDDVARQMWVNYVDALQDKLKRSGNHAFGEIGTLCFDEQKGYTFAVAEGLALAADDVQPLEAVKTFSHEGEADPFAQFEAAAPEPVPAPAPEPVSPPQPEPAPAINPELAAIEKRAEEVRLEAEKRAEKERVEAEIRAEKERKEAEERAEKERIEAEKRAEKERIEAEKRAEKERIEAEKRAEKERIEAEKRAEKERIEAEKRAEKERKRQEKEAARQAEAAAIEAERARKKAEKEAAYQAKKNKELADSLLNPNPVKEKCEEKKKCKCRGWWLILLLLLLVGGAAWYYFSQKESPKPVAVTTVNPEGMSTDSLMLAEYMKAMEYSIRQIDANRDLVCLFMNEYLKGYLAERGYSSARVPMMDRIRSYTDERMNELLGMQYALLRLMPYHNYRYEYCEPTLQMIRASRARVTVQTELMNVEWLDGILYQLVDELGLQPDGGVQKTAAEVKQVKVEERKILEKRQEAAEEPVHVNIEKNSKLGYDIIAGFYLNKTTATNLTAKLHALGSDAYIIEKNDLYYVSMGSAATRTAAEALYNHIKSWYDGDVAIKQL